jgi:enamine deaminase RidA (YjgF/YER057c/UK114 family)
MSQAVVHGDTVYLAGLVADDTTQDVAGQTRQILAKADRYLAQAGSAKSNLLRVQIWLSDIATFGEMNSVYDPWIDKANPPARACVESRLAGPQYKVEIMMTAAR